MAMEVMKVGLDRVVSPSGYIRLSDVCQRGESSIGTIVRRARTWLCVSGHDWPSSRSVRPESCALAS